MREHAKAVRDQGHHVVVLHLAGPRTDGGGGVWTMEEELDPSLTEGIETHHVFTHRRRLRGASYGLYLWSAIRACHGLRARGFRPDVVHAHIFTAGVPAAIIGTRAGIPVVLTEQFSSFPRRTLSRVDVRKARYAFGRAARALPVSRHLLEAIRSYGIDVPFEVVPNVVDTSLFFPPDTGRERDTADRRLLFVGNLEPSQSKGFPTLLQALARLNDRRRDWRLDVFGDGPERGSYEASAGSLGLGEQLRFHGSQPKTAIAETMRAADLFVLPSRFDNLPCAVVEALASGLPVVSTTVGGIPELVDEQNGRLVAPDDPVALADTIDDILGNLDTYDRGAIAAAARDQYSLEVVGDRLGRIYESVLGARR